MEEPHDRGPIEPRSYSFHPGIIPTRSDDGRPRSMTTIDARSLPDRGPIMPPSGLFLKQNSSQTRCGVEAASSPCGTAPTTLAKCLHNRSNDPRSSGQFPSLKACISLLCSSTFDRLVNKLSEFRGRSLVHRDPPAFRLDCEAIGAGLITNFS